jgi:hypothetical protein
MAEDSNSGIIGIAAAKMMEKIEEKYPNGVKVSDALICVEIEVPVPPPGFDWNDEVSDKPVAEIVKDWDATEVFDFYATNDRSSVQRGLIHFTSLMIDNDYEVRLMFDEPEDDDE